MEGDRKELLTPDDEDVSTIYSIIFAMTIEKVYLCYSCLCFLFAAYGGYIPGSDEQAPEKLPGKVDKGVGGEGLKLFYFSWSSSLKN